MPNPRYQFALATVLAAVLAVPASADDAANCKQIDEILAELRRLRVLFESKFAPGGTQAQIQTRTVKVDVGDNPFLGPTDAPLTIVEFTDFQCPYCQRFYQDTFPDLKKNYIDSGKVRFYSMDLPLEIHRNALLAAQAGRCAGERGQFWAMRDLMQAKPARLEMTNLMDYARDLGMDIAAFHQCLESGKYKQDIAEVARDATNKGARGTPAFVVGKSTPAGVEGELVVGAQPYGWFDERLKQLAH